MSATLEAHKRLQRGRIKLPDSRASRSRWLADQDSISGAANIPKSREFFDQPLTSGNNVGTRQGLPVNAYLLADRRAIAQRHGLMRACL